MGEIAVNPAQPSPIRQWKSGASSQQGGRHEQQDRWDILQLPSQATLFAVVADGMGGHVDGALGAQIVIDVARNFIQNPPVSLPTDPATALDQLCQSMHDTINRRSETARSTAVMVWLDHDRVHWLNIGDSRLYHFRQGQRLMRTRDHSAVQILMDLGEIDETQMATHPAQNRLYRCLGGEEQPKPDQGQFTAQPGDLLALCSDGVWEYITETELWTTVIDHGPTTAARLLVEQAAQRGGTQADNATLVLLHADANAMTGRTSWLRWLPTGLASLLKRNS